MGNPIQTKSMPSNKDKAYTSLTDEEYYDWLKNYKQWEKSLTPQELDAVKAYTGNSFNWMNKSLRNGETGYLTPQQMEQIQNLQSALSKMPLPDNFKLYRGTDADLLKTLFGIDDFSPESLQSIIGKSYTEKGFLSTSGLKDSSFAEVGGVEWEIKVPAGTEGAFVEGISPYGEFESEILVNSGYKISVESIREENGIIHIVAEITEKGE